MIERIAKINGFSRKNEPIIELGAELIRCKDCKYKYTEGENVTANYCLLAHNLAMPDDWYCADAEREEDGDSN